LRVGVAYIDVRVNLAKYQTDLTKLESMARKTAANIQTSMSTATTGFRTVGTAAAASTKGVNTLTEATNRQSKSLLTLIPHVAQVTIAYMAARTAWRALATGVGVGAEFEQKMAYVKAITNRLSPEFKNLNEQFKALSGAAKFYGETTVWTAVEAAEALKFLAMAGFSAVESIKALPGVLNLALIGNIELGRATDIATDILRAMGLEVDQMDRVVDVFTATITRTNTNVEMMGQAMKFAAPVAGVLGYQIEQVAAAIGILSQSGIKAGIAGRGLQQMMIRNTMAARTFGATLGSDVFEVLAKVEERQKRYTKSLGAVAAQEKILNELRKAYGLISLKGVLVIKENINAYKELYEIELKAAGETERAAKIIQETVTSSFKILGAVISSVSIEAWGEYQESIRLAIDSASEWIRDHRDQIVDMIDVMAKHGPDVLEFIAIFAGFKILISVSKMLYGFAAAMYAAAAGTVALSAAMKANLIFIGLYGFYKLTEWLFEYQRELDKAIEKSKGIRKSLGLPEKGYEFIGKEPKWHDWFTKRLFERKVSVTDYFKAETSAWEAARSPIVKSAGEITDGVRESTKAIEEFRSSLLSISSAKLFEKGSLLFTTPTLPEATLPDIIVEGTRADVERKLDAEARKRKGFVEQDIKRVEELMKDFDNLIKTDKVARDALRELYFKSKQETSLAWLTEAPQVDPEGPGFLRIEGETAQKAIMSARMRDYKSMVKENESALEKIDKQTAAYALKIIKTEEDKYTVMREKANTYEKESLAAIEKNIAFEKSLGVDADLTVVSELEARKAKVIEAAQNERWRIQKEVGDKITADIEKRSIDLLKIEEDKFAKQRAQADSWAIENLALDEYNAERSAEIWAFHEKWKTAITLDENAQRQKDVEKEAKVYEKAQKQKFGYYRAALGEMKGINTRYNAEYLDQIEAANLEEYKLRAKAADNNQAMIAIFYAAMIQKNKEAMRELALSTEDFFAGFRVGHERMLEDQMTWAKSGLNIYEGLVSESSTALSDILFSSLQSDMVEFEEIWQAFWKSLLRTFTDALADMVAQDFMDILFGSSSSTGGIFGLVTGLFSGSPTPTEGWSGGTVAASGGVFDKGNLVPFSYGGIVNNPTIFPMARGEMGLMGESGPEAILPLKRTPSGDLGVISDTQNNGEVTFNVTINAVDSKSFSDLTERNPQAIVGPFLKALQQGGYVRDTLRGVM